MAAEASVKMTNFSDIQSKNTYLDSPEFAEVNSGKAAMRKRKICIMTIVLVILALILIALIVFIIVREVNRAKPLPQVCTSIACANSAASIANNMDQTADPCKDFYVFACGEWMKKQTYSPGQSKIGTFTALRDSTYIILKNFFDGVTDTSKVPAFKTTKVLYNSCVKQVLNATTANSLLQPYFDLFGVPYITTKTKWPPSVEEYIGKLSAYLIANPVIDMGIGMDDMNTSRYVLRFDQPSVVLGIPERYKPGNILNAYNETMIKYLTQIYKDTNVKKTALEIRTIVERLIKMETYIAENIKTSRRNATALYHIKPVQYLMDNAPKINWVRLINSFFAGSGVNMTNSSEILIAAPEYLPHANYIMENCTIDDLGIYATLRIIDKNVDYLPTAYRDAKKKLMTALTGSPGEDLTWKKCIAYVQSHMPNPVDRAFADLYFDKAAKKEAVEMVANIRQAFGNLLEKNTWMDKDTKKIALEKANVMGAKVAYPDYIMNDALLVEEAAKYNITNDFSTNNINILKMTQASTLAAFNKPVDRNVWITKAVVVNAFYLPSMNQIYIPVGILQPPFYGKDRPKYLNYGGSGLAIGHEITHGFDDQGSQMDKQGNLRKWWKAEAVNNFIKQKQCIIDQYSNYTAPPIPTLHVNGILTQGENIADNGGIKQAFEGYRIWREKHQKTEDKLPGLKYTPEQLFFIGFAQSWCEKMLPQAWAHKIATNSHSPGMYRVIGSLSNTKEFAKVFNCPRNSPMNPDKKCSVW